MEELEVVIDRLATDTRFSGVVRVDVDGATVLAAAYGLADRAHGVANTVDTQLGIASGGKGLTALTIMSLVESGELALSTTARSALGADLPLIANDVTVEHLLAHRSGIGDYIDESELTDIDAFVLPVAVSELATTEQFLRVLDGHATKFASGERFAYNNGGYVVLALVAERATGVDFAELVRQRVCAPAGMTDTAFVRSDELTGQCAVGYLADDGLRSNVFHLPVRGTGDGGVYSTAADIHVLWSAFLAGRIVSAEHVALMVHPRSDAPEHAKRYGLGFWLGPSSDAVMLEGYDAGVSFRTVHHPTDRVTYTVLSNTSEGAWPIARELAARFPA